MIVPEWVEPEEPAWAGPDLALPTLYEFVESAGPFIGRAAPAAPPAAPSSPAPASTLAAEAVAEEPAAEEEPVAEAPKEPSVLHQLALVPDVEGPHVRLALLWATATAAMAVAGRYWLAVWLAGVAFVAGGQVVKSWRRRPARPSAAVVVFGAAALPIAAAVGTTALAIVAAIVLAAAVVAPMLTPAIRGTDRGRENPALTVAFALGLGMAAAAPVITRQRGLVPTLVLLTLVGVYDASAYVVGAGATNLWEGPAAGIAFMAAVTLAVAAVFVPPFTGASPWVLGLVAAVCAPFGPIVASLLLAERARPAQALRRLDSLLVLGPVWAAASLVLLKS